MAESRQRLTAEESQLLAGLMGSRCQSLAVAKAQLHLTRGPDHYRWMAGAKGVVSLIKDGSRRSLYFRLFDLHMQAMQWEQDLRQVGRLDAPPFQGFLSFQAESSHVGLQFADEEEALTFFKQVEAIVMGDSRKRAFTQPEPEAHALSNRRHSLALPLASTTPVETKSSKQSNGNVAKSLFYKIKKGKFAKKEAEKVAEVQVQVQKVSEIDMEDEDTRRFMERMAGSGFGDRNHQPEVPEVVVSPSYVERKAPEVVPRQLYTKKGSPNLSKSRATTPKALPPTAKAPPPTTKGTPPPKAPRAPVPPPRKMDWGRETSVELMDTDGEIQFEIPEGDFLRDDDVTALDDEIEGSSEA